MPEVIISVVIPTYNSSEFITKTLESLTNQTFKYFEVIVVNDGSTDNTEAVISDYTNKNHNLCIRLINQQNKGIAAARNKGIREAKGYYIAFLDHDDIWYPDKLDICYRVFQEYQGIDLVCHNEVMRSICGEAIRNLNYGPFVPDMFRRLLFKGNCLSPSATIIKKSALLEIGLFREYPHFITVEDYDLWLRLSKKYKFYFIKRILGEYLVNEKNASLANLGKHFKNQIAVLELNFKEYDKKKIFDCLLINLRIFRLYLSIAKVSLGEKKIMKALRYLFIAFPQLFRNE